MAEERALGLARAEEFTDTDEEPSKEELQRRMGEARDSISNTVTEIKETVANQVQAVKDTLDWREQFKKRPVAWSAGAAGVGFCLGYCIAAYAKGDERDQYSSAIDRYSEEESRYYAAQPILGSSAAAAPQAGTRSQHGNGTHAGPGLLQKVTSSHAFERVRDEAGSLGDAVVQELSNTAKTVVIPALITTLRNFIGEYLPNAKTATQGATAQKNQSRQGSSYQPSLERNPS